MNFLTNTNNLLLLATLVASGLALALPNLLGIVNKRLLSVHAAVQAVNQRQAQIVDVRSADEFKSGHVAGSKNLPLDRFDNDLGQLKLDINKPLILICLSGQRANTAANKFKKAGYVDVACIEGGINAWRNAGLPLVN
jgi:rhodanese-related sulfurtransferase